MPAVRPAASEMLVLMIWPPPSSMSPAISIMVDQLLTSPLADWISILLLRI